MYSLTLCVRGDCGAGVRAQHNGLSYSMTETTVPGAEFGLKLDLNCGLGGTRFTSAFARLLG